MSELYKIKVLDKHGNDLDRVVDLSCFASVKDNDNLVYLAIKHYFSNQKQGTRKTKERGEVAGSTRKIVKQKGTGGARRGNVKSPLLRGGGIVFGPRPGFRANKMNKKERRMAFLCVFKSKIENQKVIVIDNIDLDSFKTKDFIPMLSELDMDIKKNLIITNSYNRNLVLGSRNLQNVLVRCIDKVNIYEVLNTNKIILIEDCVDTLCDKMKI